MWYDSLKRVRPKGLRTQGANAVAYKHTPTPIYSRTPEVGHADRVGPFFVGLLVTAAVVAGAVVLLAGLFQSTVEEIGPAFDQVSYSTSTADGSQ